MGLPGKGLEDPRVIALIDNVRGAIIQHANPTWLSHSPAICEGMEDYIRATEAQQYAERLRSESVKQSTIVTQAPPPVPVTAPQDTIPPCQVAMMPVHTWYSPLRLKVASLSHSRATASLLFQPQSNSPASSTRDVPDAIIVEHAARSRKRTTITPEVSLSISLRTLMPIFVLSFSSHTPSRPPESETDLKVNHYRNQRIV